MPATVSADVDKPITARPAAPRPRRARRPRDHGRWLREARGIIAMAVAGFAVVSLAVFDPALHPTEQGTSVGPVGAWLGWALFRSLGYAGFLLPLLVAAWGLSAFTRPRLRPRLGAAGRHRRAGARRGGPDAAVGGHVRRPARDTRRDPGDRWLGGLGADQWPVEHARPGRDVAAAAGGGAGRRAPGHPGVVRRDRPPRDGAPGEAAPPARGPARGPASGARHRGARRSTVEPEAEVEPALPVVVEPSLPRGRLMEQGLAWQETFDFGKGGAQSFQLPPVGLLKPPPVEELRRTREELQDNAEILRRKLQDFEVDGRIVQVSPGPIITSYEFEPAAGVKVSQVVNLSDDLALALKAASVRIVGPIPGRGTVAIEVPNDAQSTVYLREIFVSAEFAESKGKLPLALGKDVQRPAGGRRSHRHAAPAHRRRHRQRQVGRPQRHDLLDPLQGHAGRRALPDDRSQASGAVRLRGHPAPAGAGGDRLQGGGGPPALDRRQDGRALQDAAGQAGAQHRRLQPRGHTPRTGCRTGWSWSTSWPTS